jgi:hypothetical protein
MDAQYYAPVKQLAGWKGDTHLCGGKGTRPLCPIKHVLAAFPKTKLRGCRPPGSAKQALSIRLDKDVMDKFRATGAGWQSRINEALKRARV